MSIHPALTPVRIGGTELPNRAVVAPMSRVSTSGDGVPTERMADYYREFALGGFGLITTEGTYTDDQHSQAYPDQPGLTSEAHAAGWREVVRAVHDAGGRIALQLMHAGALSQLDRPTIAPSAVAPKGAKMPAYGGGAGPFRTPAEATEAEIAQAIAGFAATAARAREAGFDAVEVHGANGYLVDQFITDYTNLRSDRYGGSVANRAHFAAEVLRAVRAAVGPEFPVGIRLSQTKVNDFEHRWPGGVGEAEVIFGSVAAAGADYLHLASEGRDWAESAQLAPGVTITRLAKEITGLPVIANGGMHEPARAEPLLSGGEADLVALGRGALANPDWPRLLAGGGRLREFDRAMLTPDVTLSGQPALR
ncbi:2,4-dienoyl-CoA reductase [Saccharopolyspora antimicrobica]|uniref:2,4-dienoyl-CoA reductase n=1 Tax=Saccharopolyspora antimicrobica TaxID=455193 RepID=A0A1I5CRK0_9PSEU|nr:NADH:flavin oxidoreductase [Saccharopolyspora antimicrobica]RKT88772.1 2,4-dienoyl-CoA reductase-like NADH-dependent reductase (Old Yellow Enzyme family) [Saccharopolyspora antimicrobica]SFN89563.1 2,4-dienoyl-CoA reductase [Saccharopolyspora antimicrobica]